MLSQLARGMEQEGDPKLTLTFVVTNAVDVVPGTQEASISLVTGRRRVRAEVPAGPMCTAIDTIQTETGEGPCLDAAFVDEVVRVPDVVAETRWLDFSRRAAAAGVGSMLVFRLFVREDTLGALVLASARPYGFDEESEHVGSLLAVHAALALGGAQQQQQLQAGLSSRDVIGQAKGILMERYGLTGEVAFSLLVRVSRTANRKLRDVCDELIATRELAGQPRQAKAEA